MFNFRVLFGVSWNSSAVKHVAGFLGWAKCGPDCPGYDPTWGACPYCK